MHVRAGNSNPVRIAMWSGPRNISTALLRSWGNRPDTYVTDEPLYAHYLHTTGYDHPGAAEVIASQPTDWREVAAWLAGPVPLGKRVWYQKHMAHHLLPVIQRGWLESLTNCFLIREPREMITSLLRILPLPTLADTGLPQQWSLFEAEAERTGTTPVVLEAKDVLADPRRMLTTFCAVLDIPFTEAMLTWPAGPRETDGVWAKHWYGAVERSTGFQPYQPKPDLVPAEFSELLAECEQLYARLYEYRLRAGGSA
jgi:hypothetical protein